MDNIHNLARERIEKLLDKGSFVELDQFVKTRTNDFDLQKKSKPGDGVITGYGTMDKRLVFLYSQDFSVMGGSLGEMHAQKIVKVQKLARKNGAPFIAINDSGGARIQEGINGLDGYAEIFKENVLSSGVIPQISLILGPCAGGAAYSPALMDFIFMIKKKSKMFITGPEIIKTTTSEEINFEELGGAEVHNSKSGVAHFIVENEEECLRKVKKLLEYLPSNNLGNPPAIKSNDLPSRLNEELKEILPENSKESYNIKDILVRVVDQGTFFEVQENFAKNIVIGFARLNNLSAGIVANQPAVMAGSLDINASVKIARFVRFCNIFNFPIINFVDVPGYLPGIEQEHNGIIRHGAKIISAYAEATVPKISLILRKAYGGAYIALASKQLGFDQVIAWPSAEIAVMGSEPAINIIYKKELQNTWDPENNSENFLKKKVEEYEEKFLNPQIAAEQGKIDLIIEPSETRRILIKTLHMLNGKRDINPPKKYSNIPL